MLESTGRCVAVSEPSSPDIITYNYRKFGDSPKLRQLARDVVRWECRPYPTMQPPPLAYVLKLRPKCISALPLLRWCHLLIVERCNERICVHVYFCLCLLTRISGTARPNFTKCSVLVVSSRGSIVLWRLVICRVLPVLWITSCFLQWALWQRDAAAASSFTAALCSSSMPQQWAYRWLKRANLPNTLVAPFGVITLEFHMKLWFSKTMDFQLPCTLTGWCLV